MRQGTTPLLGRRTRNKGLETETGLSQPKSMSHLAARPPSDPALVLTTTGRTCRRRCKSARRWTTSCALHYNPAGINWRCYASSMTDLPRHMYDVTAIHNALRQCPCASSGGRSCLSVMSELRDMTPSSITPSAMSMHTTALTM